MSPGERKIELLREEFGKELANPVAAVNLALGIALNGHRINGRFSGGHILFEFSEIESGPLIAGNVGMFRSMLARLGNAIGEISRMASANAQSAQSGHLAESIGTQFNPDPDWRVVGASFQEYPGSPLYNVRGELVFRNNCGVTKTLNVEMENTASSQWFLIR
jgi:hypothetical protein